MTTINGASLHALSFPRVSDAPKKSSLQAELLNWAIFSLNEKVDPVTILKAMSAVQMAHSKNPEASHAAIRIDDLPHQVKADLTGLMQRAGLASTILDDAKEAQFDDAASQIDSPTTRLLKAIDSFVESQKTGRAGPEALEALLSAHAEYTGTPLNAFGLTLRG